MDLKHYLSAKCTLIENHLDQLVPEEEVPYRTLFSAARYSLLGGGKRLRPILTLATVETLGGNQKSALTPACALELIHTYSLIHDDLPCMDDDDFRRGKPSLHKAFAEGKAVLAGDFLLTHAFHILAIDPHLTSEKKVQLMAILAQRSGSHGMIGGQIMDLEAQGKSIDRETLQLIHLNKTAAMITASIEFGGILSDVSQNHLHILQRFGQQIGLAFQIVDDVLDVTASIEKHGRETASDVMNEKATYVTLLGLEESQATAEKLFQSALETLSRLPFDMTLLANLAETIVYRKR